MKRGKPLERKTPLRAKAGLKSGKALKNRSKAPSKMRQSAKGQPCLVRVPGICCGDSETVVLAHLNGAGMAVKHSDAHAAYACRTCHAWLDGGYARTHTRDQRDLLHLQAVIRTQEVMIEDGHIILQGAA